MTASRTSNKQILTAIEAQTSAIAALAAAISGKSATVKAESPVPVVDVSEPEVTRDVPSKVRVPADYMRHMRIKAQDHANAKGEDVVLYARVNLAGEQKLAYCLKSRWTSLRDKGLIGAVAQFNAS